MSAFAIWDCQELPEASQLSEFLHKQRFLDSQPASGSMETHKRSYEQDNPSDIFWKRNFDFLPESRKVLMA